eukprot:1245090-Prymnesium_polylepis.2
MGAAIAAAFTIDPLGTLSLTGDLVRRCVRLAQKEGLADAEREDEIIQLSVRLQHAAVAAMETLSEEAQMSF